MMYLGVLSGLVGATGNLGGVIFAVIFRHFGKAYHTSLWILGVISIVINLATAWIPPVPKEY
jgi:NNP family nitrate/nitrite transporter-like MFS transporter